jgi:hypothetical protein
MKISHFIFSAGWLAEICAKKIISV